MFIKAASQSTVTHNKIVHFHYTGISIGWTWNYIETSNHNNEISYNYIAQIGLRDLSDMGCVYHLGYDPGTVINNNICVNVTSYSYGGWGYYTDQASRFVTVSNNIAYETKCGGFHQHYGLSNQLTNNIFALVNSEACDAAIRSSAHDSPGDEGDRSSFTFSRNIVYVASAPVFFATTNNSFSNETFDNNVYWVENGGAQAVTFPCNPNQPYSDQNYLLPNDSLSPGMYIRTPTLGRFVLLNKRRKKKGERRKRKKKEKEEGERRTKKKENRGGGGRKKQKEDGTVKTKQREVVEEEDDDDDEEEEEEEDKTKKTPAKRKTGKTGPSK